MAKTAQLAAEDLGFRALLQNADGGDGFLDVFPYAQNAGAFDEATVAALECGKDGFDVAALGDANVPPR